MTRSKLFSLLLCMLVFLSVSSSLPAQAAKSDFFYLTLTWPGSSCNDFLEACCMPQVESMETYDSYTGKMVTNCNSTCTFYVNEFEFIIPVEEIYRGHVRVWPDVSCPSNNGVSMWKSTFCKYGLCSNLTQQQYFQRALALRQDLDLLVLLGKKGIVPSNTELYDLEDIESALRAKYPFSFVVECSRNWLKFGEHQLSKIRYCVSMDGTKFISCPISWETSCGDKVKFPLFTYDMLSNCLSNENEMNPIEMPTHRDEAI